MSATDSLARAGAVPARADLQRLLTALVKIALVGEAGETAAWRTEATEAQRSAARAASDGPLPALDGIWTLAVRAAERDPAVRRDETVNPTLPAMSPFEAVQLVATPFDVDQAVQTVRDLASFG